MTFLNRPISAALLGMSLIILVLVFMPQIRKRRDEVFTESDA